MSVEITKSPIVDQGRRALPAPADSGEQRRFGHGAHRDANAVHDYAIELMAAVEQEIGDLWRDTLGSGDRQLSTSLVDLSHAVRRAALAFENEPAIGRPALSRTDRIHLVDGSSLDDSASPAKHG